MQQNIFGCVEGAQSYYLANYSAIGKPTIYLSRNDVELKQVSSGLLLFEPNAEVYSLPAGKLYTSALGSNKSNPLDTCFNSTSLRDR